VVTKSRVKEALIWIYVWSVPLQPTLVYITLAYVLGRLLDFWEKVLLLLVLNAHFVLHTLIVFNFIKLVGGECEEQMG
jgi:hypothetical protein